MGGGVCLPSPSHTYPPTHTHMHPHTQPGADLQGQEGGGEDNEQQDGGTEATAGEGTVSL